MVSFCQENSFFLEQIEKIRQGATVHAFMQLFLLQRLDRVKNGFPGISGVRLLGLLAGLFCLLCLPITAIMSHVCL